MIDEDGDPGSTESPRLDPRDVDRFEEVVLEHLDAAHNLARYLLRDLHAAEDAVQEAFLRAVRGFRGFRGGDGRAWLLRIVRNTCFTHLRRRRSPGEAVPFEEELHSAADEDAGPEADLDRALAADRLREELARLPVEFREVLVLRELEGLAYKEIAQVTEVPIGTVMSRLSRARRLLIAALTGAGEHA